ncbi:MAG: hypothetical protein LBT18_03120 [Endomicrobium sp.]|jgi:hypothetical protein|nr:hypothetical protein [Endomicrobium sp.]
MLDNIKMASSVKVEGQTEDIELNLSNGRIIYSQVKSVNNIDNTSNNISKLTESIRTLNNAVSSNRNNTERLIYITNSPNPFNDKSTVAMFSRKARVPFISLPNSCKNKIRKIIADNSFTSIREDLLEVHIIPFFGENESRYETIKTTVIELKDELLGF